MTELGGLDLLIAWGAFASLLLAFLAVLLRQPTDVYEHLERPLRDADAHVPTDQQALRGAEISDPCGLLGSDQEDDT